MGRALGFSFLDQPFSNSHFLPKNVHSGLGGESARLSSDSTRPRARLLRPPEPPAYEQPQSPAYLSPATLTAIRTARLARLPVLASLAHVGGYNPPAYLGSR